MKNEAKIKSADRSEKLIENVDYYFENGLMILTEHFLLGRGFCCQNGCRNCPYQTEKYVTHNKNVSNS